VNIKKYKELSRDCDQVLLNNPIPGVVANNYLHLIRAHPETNKKYNLSSRSRIYLPLLFRVIQMVRILQSIFLKNNKSSLNSKSEVLFISHLTNHSQLEDDNDPYFGMLPNDLSNKGLISSIALINHIGATTNNLSNTWAKSKVQRLILNSNLSFMSEIRLYISQFKTKKYLNHYIKNYKLDNLFSKAIMCFQFSSSTFTALRIGLQIGYLVKKSNVKYIITTYEGHSWERLVFYYARKANSNIKCFGYQHSAVFEHQNSIRRSLSNEYNPDVILASGKMSEKILKESQLKVNNIICLGSSRNLIPNFSNPESNCCLVIPEGVIGECLSLFNISLIYAKEYKNQIFLWRLHPLLSFSKLKKISPIFNKLPKNIYLSNDNLDNDILKCDSVLYRGSTAVVNAINSGLKPIYYQQSIDEINIDPIYQLNKGKYIVNNLVELGEAFREDVDKVSKQSLQDFAQNFYTPLDIEILLKEFVSRY
jgi:hypothetical protein